MDNLLAFLDSMHVSYDSPKTDPFMMVVAILFVALATIVTFCMIVKYVRRIKRTNSKLEKFADVFCMTACSIFLVVLVIMSFGLATSNSKIVRLPKTDYVVVNCPRRQLFKLTDAGYNVIYTGVDNQYMVFVQNSGNFDRK